MTVASGEPIISARDLICRYGPTVALDRLSLDVFAGEVFGFLGHNGAGKTTTVRLLNGLLRPDEGTARVLGRSPFEDGDAVRRSTGVLTETPALDERLTAEENLRYFARFYDVPEERAEARVAELLAEFELADRARERVGGYSKGMKQRLALARLLLHDPQLLFLDEPTAALDPVAARHLHDTIRRSSRERQRTVFLCTHNLNEAEELCGRVAVLAKGRVLAVGTPAELARRLGPELRVRVEVEAADRDRARGVIAEALRDSDIQPDGVDTLVIDRLARTRVPNVVALLAGAGVRIYRVDPQEPTLEDVYFALQRERDGGAA